MSLHNFNRLSRCEVHSDKKTGKDIPQTELHVAISDEGGVDSSARALSMVLTSVVSSR